MKYFKKIPGERVYLSPISLDDIKIYAEWLNEPAVAKNIGGSHYVNSVSACNDWFEKKAKDDFNYYFAIVKQENAEPIGCIEFIEYEHTSRIATVALFIGNKENRGKGYGTEAMKLMLGYGFDVLNFNNIDLKVYDFNEQAFKSYIKAGFKEYGRRRGAYYLNNKRHDVIFMDITREDWYSL